MGTPAFDALSIIGMRGNMTEEKQQDTLASVSLDEVIMGVGLGLTFAAFEAWRYPSISATGSVDSALNMSFSPIAVLLVILALCLFSRHRLLRNNIVIATVAVLASITLLAYSSLYINEQPSEFVQAIARFHMVFGVLLVVLWFDELLHQESNMAINAMMIGLFTAFVLQVAVALLNESISFGVCSLMSIISALFFALHRQSAAARMSAVDDGHSSTPRGKMALSALKRISVFVPGCIALLFCGMLFNILNHMWRTGGIGVFSPIEIQVFSAAGALLAALVLLFLSRPIGRGIIEMFLVVFSLMALLIASFSEFSVPIYLIPLNAAQKLTFVMMLLAGQRLNDAKVGLAAVCALFVSYRVGLASLHAAQNVLTGVPFGLTETFANNVIIAVGSIVLLVYAAVELVHIHDRTAELRAAASPTGKDIDWEAIEGYKRAAFNYFLMQRFGLTQREAEIILLVEQGKNAKAISDDLVISQSTAKSHLRNIYAKVDIHSQSEAIALLQEQRDYFFHS